MHKARSGSFSVDFPKGTWSFRVDGHALFGITDATSAVTVNGRTVSMAAWRDPIVQPAVPVQDPLGMRDRVVVEARIGAQGLRIRLVFEVFVDRPQMFVSAEIRNGSSRSCRVGKCNLLTVNPSDGGGLDLGPEPERQTVFLYDGTPVTQYVKRITHHVGKHDAGPLCHIHNPASGCTYHVAFLTFDRAHGRHLLTYRKRDRDIRHTAYCDFADYELRPGQTLASETLSVDLADSPYTTLERWADLVREIYQPPVAGEAVVGWLGYGWVDPFSTELSESVIDRNSAAIRRRLEGFGVDYIWISITNIKDGLAGNWLEFDELRFPHGLQWLLDLLKERRLELGLWMAPFWVAEGSSGFEENRGNLLMDRAGTPRKAKRWWWAYKAGQGNEPYLYCLDSTHPRTIAYLKRIMDTYREMGARYFMLDFVHGGMPMPGDILHDSTMVNGPETYRHGLLTLRKAAGPDMHLLMGTGAGLQNIGVANSSRIGADYGEGRPLLPRFNSYPATYQINGAEHSTATPHRNALNNIAATYFTHRRLWLNNANMLTVDKPMSRSEAELTTTLFGMTGSPIMLGDDIDTMHEERLAMVKKVLPRSPDTAFPIDLFERVYPEDYPRVLLLPVETDWGCWHVVAVFNLGTVPDETVLSADDLGLVSGRRYRVFDFWQELYCGCFSGELRVPVPALSCRVLRIDAVRDHPWLLSTDMHVRQGQVEITSLAWDVETMTLSGSARRPKGETGTLFIVAPPGFKPGDYRGLGVAKDSLDESLIIRRTLHFDGAEEPWQIAFERTPAAVDL